MNTPWIDVCDTFALNYAHEKKLLFNFTTACIVFGPPEENLYRKIGLNRIGTIKNRIFFLGYIEEIFFR